MVTAGQKHQTGSHRCCQYIVLLFHQLNKDNARIEYFIPKICNVEMVNKIPGVNKVNDDSIGTTGAIEVEVKDLPTALFNFISMVPTDMDIVHNYGRGI